ncbi:MAG: hypothetical protein EAZ30_00785 [Betaproteobacteria bacterium]|nr:MAG: hypothetical protein EAZ30_00785 [Betaproteobacteria bacterium]
MKLSFVNASALIATTVLASVAVAHHGWSSFDETKPIYLEGTIKSAKWQNPHVELMLDINGAHPPEALARFNIPKQSANVDAVTVLGNAKAPSRKDKTWNIELAPLTRVETWKIPELKAGEKVAVVGYTFKDQKGEAILRAEFLIRDGKATPLRSNPAQ